MFQSSPDPQAGRYTSAITARRPAMSVSILARPAGRALLCNVPRGGTAPEVSILARPAGRALHVARVRVVRQWPVSILARPAGRALPQSPARLARIHRFPSSPDPQAGRYDGCRERAGDGDGVSILARPAGRALRAGECPAS